MGLQKNESSCLVWNWDGSGSWQHNCNDEKCFSPPLAGNEILWSLSATRPQMNTTWLRMVKSHDGPLGFRETAESSWKVLQLGTVTHEIAHSLGFYHTQSRYDRNDYVSVDMDNINPDLQYNFAQVYCSEREFCGLLLVNGVFQMTRKTSTHFGLPYDYGSMMEYDACKRCSAFSPETYAGVGGQHFEACNERASSSVTLI